MKIILELSDEEITNISGAKGKDFVEQDFREYPKWFIEHAEIKVEL